MNNKMLNKQIPFSYALQVIIAFLALILSVWTYFSNELKYISIICLSLALLVSAFNEYTISHNNKLTIFYFASSILLLILLIFGAI